MSMPDTKKCFPGPEFRSVNHRALRQEFLATTLSRRPKDSLTSPARSAAEQGRLIAGFASFVLNEAAKVPDYPPEFDHDEEFQNADGSFRRQAWLMSARTNIDPATAAEISVSPGMFRLRGPRHHRRHRLLSSGPPITLTDQYEHGPITMASYYPDDLAGLEQLPRQRMYDVLFRIAAELDHVTTSIIAPPASA